MKDIEQSFLEKVVVIDNGCWIWQAAQRATYGGFRQKLAHVWAYEHWIGAIPKGYEVDHKCHNIDPNCPGWSNCQHKLCVNPNHLEAVPPRVNFDRGHHNQYAGKTHCNYEHELTEENTYRFGPDGKWRACKTCRNARRQGKDPATYVRRPS